jgi:hypothetical protein
MLFQVSLQPACNFFWISLRDSLYDIASGIIKKHQIASTQGCYPFKYLTQCLYSGLQDHIFSYILCTYTCTLFNHMGILPELIISPNTMSKMYSSVFLKSNKAWMILSSSFLYKTPKVFLVSNIFILFSTGH